MGDAAGLSDRRELIVEDEYDLASDEAAALRGGGAELLGPSPGAGTAMHLMEQVAPTHAVVDLNLGDGGPSFDLTPVLRARGVLVICLTGDDTGVHPADLAGAVCLQKPAPIVALVEAVGRL